jgi:membrane protease YdiL (CAAX protease family)
MVDPIFVAVGLAIAFFGIDAVGVLYRRFPGTETGDGAETITVGRDLLKWVPATVLVGYVLVVEGKPLSTIGVEAMAPLSFLAWFVGGTVFTVAVTSGVYAVYDWREWTIPSGFVEDQLERPVWARTFTAVTAGVTESVLYQGYPIERLAAVLTTPAWFPVGSVAVAGGVAFLVFTAAHYVGDTFSLQETVYIGAPAFCVTVLYVLTGNLFVVIAVHGFVDGLSLLGPEFSNDEERPVATPE